MTSNILDGKNLASTIKARLHQQIVEFKKHHRPPGLAVIMLGEDPASQVYVKNKRKACEEVGIKSRAIDFPASTSEETLLSCIKQLNADPAVDGILVQLPLPSHIKTEKVIESIHPDKDVDGFHPYNIGRLAQRLDGLRPCTPQGIIHLLQSINLDLTGKDVTIVGASNIVGRPLALMMLLEGATVTVTHRFTQHLPEKIHAADIVVVAIGKPEFIQAEWIKPNAVVIDVGINRLGDGCIVGDVDFQNAKEKVSWITPVPGGVGPMTVATLLENTVIAYAKHENISLHQ